MNNCVICGMPFLMPVVIDADKSDDLFKATIVLFAGLWRYVTCCINIVFMALVVALIFFLNLLKVF